MSVREIEVINDDDPYTRVFNALIFEDNLRLLTRMVLIMMTRFRPDWDFSVRGMAAIANVTKDTMAKMLGELEAAGYVQRREQHRSAAGRFAKAGYLVSRKPIFKDAENTEHKNYDTDGPCHNLPYTKEPYTKNSPQLNTKQLTTEQLISPCSPPMGDGAPAEVLTESEPESKPAPKPKRSRQKKSVPTHAPERFEQFWAAYPGGGSRLRAVAAWDALAPDDALIDEMARALKRQMRSPQWREGIGIPHASTWLNNARWTDKLPEPPRARDGGTTRWDPEPEEAEI